jgi:hypothetical protein
MEMKRNTFDSDNYISLSNVVAPLFPFRHPQLQEVVAKYPPLRPRLCYFDHDALKRRKTFRAALCKFAQTPFILSSSVTGEGHKENTALIPLS